MDTTVDPAVESYLREALALLDDVSDDQRQELAESIEEAVLEVAAESDRDLPGTLGTPREFVAELRQASGVGEPARGGRRSAMRHRLARAGERMTSHRAWSWTTELSRELRPAWWAMRAFAILWAVAEMASGWRTSLEWIGPFPIPDVAGQVLASAVVLGGAIYGSVEIGRRDGEGWRRKGVMALNIVAVIALVALSSHIQQRVAAEGFENAYAAEPFVGDGAEGWVHTVDGRSIPFVSMADLEQIAVEHLGPVTLVWRDGTLNEYPDLSTFFDSHGRGEISPTTTMPTFP